MGKSERDVYDALALRKAVVSYDVPVGPEGDGYLRDLLPDKAGEGIEELSMENALKTSIRGLLEKLLERERFVVERRYGFRDGGRCATLEDISVELGVTRERVVRFRGRPSAGSVPTPASPNSSPF